MKLTPLNGDMSKIQKLKLPPPSNEIISRQLERMLESPDFCASPQQTDFLKFVVNQTLAGNSGEIKGYTVATEVMGRGPDFNQSIDPVVSIQAGRLRRAMERYYLTAGEHDPIRIDIPKGTYVPNFSEQLPSHPPIAAEPADPVSVMQTWPAVLIRPLRNLSGDPELDFWGIGLATELAHELNRYPDIRVMTLGSGNPHREADQATAQFKVAGNVRSDRECLKVAVRLTDTQSGRHIWSDSRRSSIETARLISFQEDIAKEVSVKIAGRQGWISKTLASRWKRRPPKHMKVYEAVLRYYEFDLHGTPETFSRAMAALERAVAIEPECGQAWTMLARLLGEYYSTDIPGYENALETAFRYAAKGIRLSPEDQRSRVIMAYIHLLRNELAAGRAEAEQALNLGPRTLFMLDAIGFLMTYLGEWERGPALVEKVIQLNPFYGNYCHFALWLNYFRQKNYAAAYRETMRLKRPATIWDPLAKAATLGLLGKTDEGEKYAKKLLEMKPDFPGKARDLIRRFVKFEEIVEREIEGLNKVGLCID
jgi:adenylate cyclase